MYLFTSDCIDFNPFPQYAHKGKFLGILSDVLSCTVEQELNSSYEMTFAYPINGVYADLINTDMIVTVPSINESQTDQAFRIYAQTKPINGVVTYKCQHISYDAANVPVLPFSVPVPRDANDPAQPAQDYLTLRECINQTIEGDATKYGLNNAMYLLNDDQKTNPFKDSISVIDNEENEEKTKEPFKIDKPSNLRNMLGGSGTTILGLFPKAELVFDNFKTIIYAKGINRDNGFSIVYGKNLIDFSQEKKISSMYTHIYPYWVNTQTTENGNSTSGLDRYRTSILWTSGKSLSEQKNSASISARTSLVSILPTVGDTNKTYLLQETAGGLIRKFVYNAKDKKYEEITGTTETTKNTEEISGTPNSSDFVDLGTNPIIPVSDDSEISEMHRDSILPKILLVDLTNQCGDITTTTTENDIRVALSEAANKYILDNKETLTKPEVSLKVSYAQLSKTMPASYMQEYDRVRIGDIVHVYFPKYNVETSSKCTKVTFDVIANHVVSIELGSERKNITTTIANQTIRSVETPTIAETKQTINETVVPAFMATKRLIDSNRGGFVQFHNSASIDTNPDNNQATPDEILILDSESEGNIEKAKGVWRWNSSGLGFFKGTNENPVYVYKEINTKVKDNTGKIVNGKAYQWVFNDSTSVGLALTADGEINADRILAGKINANLIKAGTISGVEANFGEGRLGVSKDTDGNWAVTLGDVWRIDHSASGTTNVGYSYLRNKYFGSSMDPLTADGLKADPSNDTKGLYLLDVASSGDESISWKSGFGAKMAIRSRTAYFYTDGLNTINYYPHRSSSSGIQSRSKLVIGYDNIFNAIENIPAMSNRCDIELQAYNPYSPAADSSTVGLRFAAFDAHDIIFQNSDDAMIARIGATKGVPVSIISNGPQVGKFSDGSYFIRGNYAAIWFNFTDSGPNAVCRGRWSFDNSPAGVSDRRAKNNITELTNDFDAFFDALKPVRFVYNNDPGKTHVGYIAQDVEEAAKKNLVKEYSDVFYKAPSDGLPQYSLYYNDFIALNTYEIQKLKKRVTELETLLVNKL